MFFTSLTKAVKGFTIRCETGYFNQNGKDDFIQYVMGVDREWTSLLNNLDSLFILFQYAGETITHKNHDLKELDFRRALKNSLMSKIRYCPSDNNCWTFHIEGSWNLEEEDFFLKPGITWRNSYLELESGLCLISGNPETFWGGYGRNDRVYVKMSWRF